jgi:tetratricopeptide (TPR) repeat protein
VADRYLALSSYGFCLLLAWGLCQLATSHHRIALTTSMILLLSWGTATALRLPVWRSELSYWQDALTTNPENLKATRAIGAYYFDQDQPELAFPWLARALALDPNDPLYDFYQGYAELRRKNPAGAIPHLTNALTRKGDCIMALFDLGEAYKALGNRDQAISAYQRVLTSTDLDAQGFYQRNARERLRELGVTPQ